MILNTSKKLKLTLLLIIIFANTYAGIKLSYGIFLGTNASGIFGQYMTNEIFKAGLNGGFSITNKIDNNLYFRTGVYYINKGFKTSKIKSTDYKDRDERYYFLSDYIEIPFLIQFRGSVMEIESTWMAGFGTAFNIRNRGKTKVDDNSYTVDIKDNIRFCDITLIVGTNKMVSQHFNLDLRASASLLPYNIHADFLGKRHISLLFSLGYFI